ncbi:hypothetical protein SVAN01_01747 [Stagonosporopsis vannaccii]|nr:hypothetical protein SVAN01_01747 [Stagonosporopsis vannaccii]
MPYVRGPAKAEELSWDKFSAPEPEAATWTPDPNSVPAAGSQPDTRFNKNSLAGQLKQAQKSEKLRFRAVGSSNDRPATSPTINPNRAGRWPTPIARTIVSPSASFRHTRPVTSATTEVPLLLLKTPLDCALEVASSLNCAFRARDTMDLLSVQPPSDKPPTPPSNVSSPVDVSSDDTVIPAWALPLEQLLLMPSPKPSLTSRAEQEQRQSTVLPSVSITPHLRVTTSTRALLGSRISRLDSTGQDGFIEQEQVVMPDDIQLQRKLLKKLIPEESVASLCTHKRYLQTKLISIMEEELDIKSRTTRRELSAMSDDDFKAYFRRTVTMHKLTWHTKQLRTEIKDSA